jgi:hypothetical protein
MALRKRAVGVPLARPARRHQPVNTSDDACSARDGPWAGTNGRVDAGLLRAGVIPLLRHEFPGWREPSGVAVGVQVLPVEEEAGIACELPEEGALSPAVALAERVDGIDLVVTGGTGDSLRKTSAAWVISRSAVSSPPGARSPGLSRGTPVTGPAYGSSGTYGRRYRETVLRYGSAALTSPSTYAGTSRSCSGLNAPGSSTCTDRAAGRAPSRRARWRASASYRS